jgi:quercetin dioxygenase-like cupin family protein
MNSWNVNDLELKAHAPQILSSTKDARAIALAIPAGESLQDHQVHERAWVSIRSGEAEITTTAGERIAGAPGLLVEFDPGERHAVRAVSDTRLLLLLTPWPGAGHPGPMSLPDKADAVAHAAEHSAEQRERSDASG